MITKKLLHLLRTPKATKRCLAKRTVKEEAVLLGSCGLYSFKPPLFWCEISTDCDGKMTQRTYIEDVFEARHEEAT
ncbi:hypothetical protein BGZ63DRAFT_384319 [Mariannaea sp. PMI_226]|nr:hypothetical protein BGZ63DRAFT_384319 [Mariannaea sp. PMI_226]